MLACGSQRRVQLLVHDGGGELVEAGERPIVDDNLRYRAAAAAIRHLCSLLRIADSRIDDELDALALSKRRAPKQKGKNWELPISIFGNALFSF